MKMNSTHTLCSHMSAILDLQPSTLGYVAKQDMPYHLSILFRAR